MSNVNEIITNFYKIYSLMLNLKIIINYLNDKMQLINLMKLIKAKQLNNKTKLIEMKRLKQITKLIMLKR